MTARDRSLNMYSKKEYVPPGAQQFQARFHKFLDNGAGKLLNGNPEMMMSYGASDLNSCSGQMWTLETSATFL